MTVTVTPPGQGPGATGATFAWGPFRSFAFLAAPTPPECEAPPKDQSQLVSGIGLLMGRPRYRDYSRGGGRLTRSPGPFKLYRGQAPCLPRPRFLRVRLIYGYLFMWTIACPPCSIFNVFIYCLQSSYLRYLSTGD